MIFLFVKFINNRLSSIINHSEKSQILHTLNQGKRILNLTYLNTKVTT